MQMRVIADELMLSDLWHGCHQPSRSRGGVVAHCRYQPPKTRVTQRAPPPLEHRLLPDDHATDGDYSPSAALSPSSRRQLRVISPRKRIQSRRKRRSGKQKNRGSSGSDSGGGGMLSGWDRVDDPLDHDREGQLLLATQLLAESRESDGAPEVGIAEEDTTAVAAAAAAAQPLSDEMRAKLICALTEVSSELEELRRLGTRRQRQRQSTDAGLSPLTSARVSPISPRAPETDAGGEVEEGTPGVSTLCGPF
jgi:hypothetical protein|eukprot:COSAG01_NODE_4524_length_4947_cov_56.073136_2_plen_251_part_00